MSWKATGRARYRSTWRGKLILQIEEKERTHDARVQIAQYISRWRDASVRDLPLPMPKDGK